MLYPISMTIGSAIKQVKGEDRILINKDLGIFGVFDGVGGFSGGDRAAEIAVSEVENYYQEAEKTKEPTSIKKALLAAEKKIKITQNQNGSKMSTTATVARLFNNNGSLNLAFAHVGDSRLYRLTKNELQDPILEQITDDEGRGNMLEQALGFLRKITQYGTYEVQANDRLLLCTDGVTGDWPDEQLGSHEILGVLQKNNPQKAAEKLINISKKHDDKAVLVVRV